MPSSLLLFYLTFWFHICGIKSLHTHLCAFCFLGDASTRKKDVTKSNSEGNVWLEVPPHKPCCCCCCCCYWFTLNNALLLAGWSHNRWGFSEMCFIYGHACFQVLLECNQLVHQVPSQTDMVTYKMPFLSLLFCTFFLCLKMSTFSFLKLSVDHSRAPKRDKVFFFWGGGVG